MAVTLKKLLAICYRLHKHISRIHNFSLVPYALTSRLHNNDAMSGGQELSRCAKTTTVASWKYDRIGASSANLSSICARARRRPGGMACRGWPAGCNAWQMAHVRYCLVWPPNARLAPFCRRHMHKVYWEKTLHGVGLLGTRGCSITKLTL